MEGWGQKGEGWTTEATQIREQLAGIPVKVELALSGNHASPLTSLMGLVACDRSFSDDTSSGL